MTNEEIEHASEFSLLYPHDATVIMMAASPNTANLPSPSNPSLTSQQAAQQIINRASTGPFRVTELFPDVAARLLTQGMNPGGYGQEQLWTDWEELTGPWRNLYSWNPDGTVNEKPIAELTQPEQQHLDRIQNQSIIEFINIIFASGRLCLESLLIAYATTDRINHPALDQQVQQAADGVIRLLGQRRCIESHNSFVQDTPPAFVAAYLFAIAQLHNRQPEDFANEVISHLANANCVISSVIRMHGLCLMLPDENIYECPDCRRIHLHPSGGICTECLAQLGQPVPLAHAQASPDYYTYLATQAGPLFRLNCEELTGQTNTSDARKRQGFSKMFASQSMRYHWLTSLIY